MANNNIDTRLMLQYIDLVLKYSYHEEVHETQKKTSQKFNTKKSNLI